MQVSADEKISVYKDGGSGDCVQPKCLATGTAKPTLSTGVQHEQHSRSKSDSVFRQRYAPFHLHLRSAGHKNGSNCASVEFSRRARSDRDFLVLQLQDIAEERCKLLYQLSRLERKQQKLLTELTSLDYCPSSNVATLTLSAKSTALQETSTEQLSMNVKSELSQKSIQTSGTSSVPSKHSLVPRPVSAPPRSNPSGPRRPAHTASERVALADKTEYSSDMTQAVLPMFQAQGVSQIGKGTHRMKQPASKHNDNLPMSRGRTTHVPMNFGEDEVAHLMDSSKRLCDPSREFSRSRHSRVRSGGRH